MSLLILLLLISFQVFFVIKNECNGQQSITWQRVYGGPENSDDVAYDICKSFDGYFYIAGITFVRNPPEDATYILKLNQYGDTIWTKIIRNISAYTIAPSNDGGCVFAGTADSAKIIKLNSNGEVVWRKSYTDGSTVQFRDITNTNDNGYIACGKISDYHGYILKIDSFGNLQWQRIYYSTYILSYSSIKQTNNENYILCGTDYPTPIDTPIALIRKIDNNGDIIWSKRYRGDHGSTSAIKINIINNFFLIGGNTTSFSFGTKSYFLRTDSTGNLTYEKIFYKLYDEHLYDIMPISNNKYVISLYSTQSEDSTAKVIITDSLGNIIREKVFALGEYAVFESIQPLENGDIVFAGYMEPIGSQWYDIYAVRTDSMLYATPIGINNINKIEPDGFHLFQNYTNPFNSRTIISYEVPIRSKVKIVIYDVLGRELAVLVNEEKPKGIYKLTWDAENYSSGVYYYILYTNNIHIARKLIINK